MPDNRSYLSKVYRAQDILVNNFLDLEEVNLIDIGHPIKSNKMEKQIVLRIHVSENWINAKPEERIAFPEQVEGIPVIIMFGEYEIERNF